MRGLSGPKTVTSIFLGGGTPSLMEPATVETILNGIARHWHVPDGIEITMEANPSSVEATRFRGYRAAGVNRVSLGVQALNDTDLKFLGRLHDVADALKAIGLARDIFPRMSFDLIYARPHQTVEAWRRSCGEEHFLCRRPSVALPADHRRRRPSSTCTRPASLSCPMATSPPCSTRRRRRSPPPKACRPMRSRTMQGRAPKAATTSPTGATATMPASVPARMGG